MTKKDLKIQTNDKIKQQYELAKADMKVETHEKALIKLMLICAKNGELEHVDTDVLEDAL